MRKLLLLMISGAIFTGMITGCTEKGPDGEKFSKLTVEENKASIEDAGIEFVAIMDDMSTMETIDVLINMGETLDQAPPPLKALENGSKINTTLKTVLQVANDEKALYDLFHVLAGPGELAEDPESIEDLWDDIVGTYTWNESLGDWDVVEGGDAVIVEFPSSNTSTTNDATLTISDYDGVVVANPLDDEYTGDLPVSLNMNLAVGAETLISMVYGAEYNEEGIPSSIAVELTIETYTFEVDLSNDTELISVNYKFTADGEVVMDMGATGEGLFTEENVEANTYTVTETNTYVSDFVYNDATGEWEEVYDTYTDEWEEVEFEEVINSAKAHFQLFYIAVRGEVNIKGLADQIRIIDEQWDDETISEDSIMSQYADEINEYVGMRIVNVDENTILATAEAYVEKEVNSDYNDAWINMRFRFPDESLIDVETYFENGFDNFIRELNAMINGINSEYDLDIDNVDY